MSPRFKTDTADDDFPVLEAVGEALRTWNGWRVPLVTGQQFRNYWGAVSEADPNGLWSEADVVELEGFLQIVSKESRDVEEEWLAAGEIDGQLVYALDGWCWERIDRQSNGHDYEGLLKPTLDLHPGDHIRVGEAVLTVQSVLTVPQDPKLRLVLWEPVNGRSEAILASVNDFWKVSRPQPTLEDEWALIGLSREERTYLT